MSDESNLMRLRPLRADPIPIYFRTRSRHRGVSRLQIFAEERAENTSKSSLLKRERFHTPRYTRHRRLRGEIKQRKQKTKERRTRVLITFACACPLSNVHRCFVSNRHTRGHFQSTCCPMRTRRGRSLGETTYGIAVLYLRR